MASTPNRTALWHEAQAAQKTIQIVVEFSFHDSYASIKFRHKDTHKTNKTSM
jgi:hypothetical protein